jgi:hypothetical protein
MRQARIHAPGLVGGIDHLHEDVVDQLGQALAAVIGVRRQCRPARLDVLLVGFLEALRGGHHAVALIGAALFVAALIDREDHLAAEFSGFLQHLIHGGGIDLGMRRHGLEFLLHVEQLVQDKLHIAQRRRVLAHETLQGKGVGGDQGASILLSGILEHPNQLGQYASVCRDGLVVPWSRSSMANRSRCGFRSFRARISCRCLMTGYWALRFAQPALMPCATGRRQRMTGMRWPPGGCIHPAWPLIRKIYSLVPREQVKMWLLSEHYWLDR